MDDITHSPDQTKRNKKRAYQRVMERKLGLVDEEPMPYRLTGGKREKPKGLECKCGMKMNQFPSRKEFIDHQQICPSN